MKLMPEDKFFLESENDGSLILVNEIVLEPDMLKANHLIMRGVRFDVDYEKDEIDTTKTEVEVSVSFNVEGEYVL